jgi:16S rRNA (uracil1498-N3)-methyltransferase
MRRFYASPQNFDEHTVNLGLEESRHLRDVLRMKNGDEVSVFDGEGNEFSCLIREVGKGKHFSVLRILLKNEKFDLVVQKAVELGVTKLVPILTKRADAKTARLERWQKIVIDATKQCGRAKLMRITELISFEECIEEPNAVKVLFAERHGESFSILKNCEQMIAVIGAEGGWDDAEIAAARQNDFQIITLAGRILRAETAAIAVAAVLQNQFGDFN